jgi:hypothetical protein
MLATKYASAFGHACQTETTLERAISSHGIYVKAFAVVFNHQLDAALIAQDSNVRFTCARMLDYVVQALLNDAIEVDFGRL